VQKAFTKDTGWSFIKEIREERQPTSPSPPRPKVLIRAGGYVCILALSHFDPLLPLLLGAPSAHSPGPLYRFFKRQVNSPRFQAALQGAVGGASGGAVIHVQACLRRRRGDEKGGRRAGERGLSPLSAKERHAGGQAGREGAQHAIRCRSILERGIGSMHSTG
jgi:hypothetical protein